MKEKRYRVIFNGLIQGAQVKRLISFLMKEVNLSENTIRSILTSPPYTILKSVEKNKAEEILVTLESLGSRVQLEKLVDGMPAPFSISEEHYKIVKKELSKILRVCSCLALVLVQIDKKNQNTILPSAMGDLQKQLAQYFRESDTVLGIDDNRLIVLGFSTNNDGAAFLYEKVLEAVRESLHENAVVSCGVATFPREGQSFADLLQIAESNRLSFGLTKESGGKRGGTEMSVDSTDHSLPLSIQNVPEIDFIQQCFENGRGRFFKRLMVMDSHTLFVGFSHLPHTKQKEFLERLPLGYEEINGFESLVQNQIEIVVPDEVRQVYESIFYQMERENKSENRNSIRKEIEASLSNTEALPTLPSIASQVFHIASNPKSSAADLADVIKVDQALTSKLLRIVNSAFYGFRQKVGTVRQAVVILGLDEIINLAIGLSAARVFKLKSHGGYFNPKKLWHHSIGTAIIAHALCEKFPEYQRQGIFTAGLLHDFGKILIIERFVDAYDEVYGNSIKSEIPLFELEEEFFGFNHASIGELMAVNWNMPDYLVEAISWHHRPTKAVHYSTMAAIIGLADYLYNEAMNLINEGRKEVVACNQLTYGHWAVLNHLMPDLDRNDMTQKIQDSVAILEDNQSVFDILS